MVEIIVAVIAASGGLLGSIIGVLSANRLTTYRIAQLEKKVDKHNNLVERMYKVEESAEVLKEQIKVVNHRIKDLEDE
ncbi:MAG: hypothetical protein HFE74_04405 [Firmicutes bacterium]|jgi:hypothetical protein|nr:hypothetical protein [Bacillota bacterium]